MFLFFVLAIVVVAVAHLSTCYSIWVVLVLFYACLFWLGIKMPPKRHFACDSQRYFSPFSLPKPLSSRLLIFVIFFLCPYSSPSSFSSYFFFFFFLFSPLIILSAFPSFIFSLSLVLCQFLCTQILLFGLAQSLFLL